MMTGEPARNSIIAALWCYDVANVLPYQCFFMLSRIP